MSYVQIYMEVIKDLLLPGAEPLAIREDANGVFLSNVHEEEVRFFSHRVDQMQKIVADSGLLRSPLPDCNLWGQQPRVKCYQQRAGCADAGSTRVSLSNARQCRCARRRTA